MKIAIIGTGRVAAALGRQWAARGHIITFASREPRGEKAAALVEAAGANASAATVAQAVSRSSIVVLATPFSAVAAVLDETGDLAGKVVVECTNPFAPGLRPLFDSETSGAEHIARLAPGARVVVRRGALPAAVSVPCPHPGGFDLVLADPPYERSSALDAPVLESLVAGGWLAPDALVVWERSARDPDVRWPAGFEVEFRRTYGDTAVEMARPVGGGRAADD